MQYTDVLVFYANDSSQVQEWSVAPKMRRLSRKKALHLVKELDAFPKVPESYMETTASGGTGEFSFPLVSQPIHLIHRFTQAWSWRSCVRAGTTLKCSGQQVLLD